MAPDDQAPLEARLREALTWAVGFIRCNFPAARERYEDMRNAEALAAAHPLYTGEFQLASARAELAEYERDRLRAGVEAAAAEVAAGRWNCSPADHVQDACRCRELAARLRALLEEPAGG